MKCIHFLSLYFLLQSIAITLHYVAAGATSSTLKPLNSYMHIMKKHITPTPTPTTINAPASSPCGSPNDITICNPGGSFNTMVNEVDVTILYSLGCAFLATQTVKTHYDTNNGNIAYNLPFYGLKLLFNNQLINSGVCTAIDVKPNNDFIATIDLINIYNQADRDYWKQQCQGAAYPQYAKVEQTTNSAGRFLSISTYCDNSNAAGALIAGYTIKDNSRQYVSFNAVSGPPKG